MTSDQIIVMTPKCWHCGDIGEVVMSFEDAEHGENLRSAGGLIQECYPTLSRGEREQIKTGIHPQCWALMFGQQK